MALINCPICQKQISDQATYCVHCGCVFNGHNEGDNLCSGNNNKIIGEPNNITNFEFPEKPKFQSKEKETKKIMVGIVVSVLMLVIAISLLTTQQFKHYVENIPYYTEQYEETKSHSSGFLGSSYSSLASRWNDLRNEAIIYVALHSLGAIGLSIGGGIGLYRGIKRIKNVKENNNGIN